jgi:hypothetical protein
MVIDNGLIDLKSDHNARAVNLTIGMLHDGRINGDMNIFLSEELHYGSGEYIGDFNIGKSLTVQQDVDFRDSLRVGGDITATKGLSVSGSATISKVSLDESNITATGGKLDCKDISSTGEATLNTFSATGKLSWNGKILEIPELRVTGKITCDELEVEGAHTNKGSHKSSSSVIQRCASAMSATALSLTGISFSLISVSIFGHTFFPTSEVLRTVTKGNHSLSYRSPYSQGGGKLPGGTPLNQIPSRNASVNDVYSLNSDSGSVPDGDYEW